jgi:hypothetical protein
MKLDLEKAIQICKKANPGLECVENKENFVVEQA